MNAVRHSAGLKGTGGPGPEKILERIVFLSIGVAFKGENFVWKFHASEFDPPGIPDIIGSIKGRFVGIELKVEGNYFSPFQKAKIQMIDQAGGVACGIYRMNDDTCWLIPATEVQSFSLRSRAGWMPLPYKEWRDHEGKPHQVLNLSALKVLLCD